MAPNGNKKTLFLAIFDLRSSIVKDVFDCRLSGEYMLYMTYLKSSVRATHNLKGVGFRMELNEKAVTVQNKWPLMIERSAWPLVLI